MQRFSKYKEYCIVLRSRSVSSFKSPSRESLSTSRSKTPEAINYAFTGSVDNLSSSHGSNDFERTSSVSSVEVLSSSFGNEASKGKPSRRQRSFSKSPIKSVLSKKSDGETGSESLVADKDEDLNAFDNLAMGTKWSSFVNDDDNENVSSASLSPRKMLLHEPEPVSMDRDMQPGHHSESALLTNLDFGDSFKDEVLVVETQAKDDLNDSSLSKTGFDFLDNW